MYRTKCWWLEIITVSWRNRFSWTIQSILQCICNWLLKFCLTFKTFLREAKLAECMMITRMRKKSITVTLMTIPMKTWKTIWIAKTSENKRPGRKRVWQLSMDSPSQEKSSNCDSHLYTSKYFHWTLWRFHTNNKQTYLSLKLYGVLYQVNQNKAI